MNDPQEWLIFKQSDGVASAVTRSEGEATRTYAEGLAEEDMGNKVYVYRLAHVVSARPPENAGGA